MVFSPMHATYTMIPHERAGAVKRLGKSAVAALRPQPIAPRRQQQRQIVASLEQHAIFGHGLVRVVETMGLDQRPLRRLAQRRRQRDFVALLDAPVARSAVLESQRRRHDRDIERRIERRAVAIGGTGDLALTGGTKARLIDGERIDGLVGARAPRGARSQRESGARRFSSDVLCGWKKEPLVSPCSSGWTRAIRSYARTGMTRKSRRTRVLSS